MPFQVAVTSMLRKILNMKKFLPLLLLIFFPHFAFAAIAFQSIGAASGLGGSDNIDLGSGSNNFVILQIPGGTSPSAVTIGGVSGSALFTQAGGGDLAATDVWIVKMGATTGVKTVTVTSSSGRWRGTAFSGVDQTTPVDTHGGSTVTVQSHVSVSLTPSGSNEWMWSAEDIAVRGGGSESAPTNMTSRSLAQPSGCSGSFTGCNWGDSAGTISGLTTQTFNWSASNNDWVMVSATINPASAATTVTSQILLLLHPLWIR